MKKIKKFIAECVCLGIEMYMQKYRLYKSYYEIIPMSDEEFRKELTEHNTEKFCESYFKNYNKYKTKS